MSGLYIHIPFCVRRCLYCAFYLEPLGTGPISKRLRDHHQIDNSEFLDALEAELQALPSSFLPRTIYIGGGTPTELSAPDFARLFEVVHRHIQLEEVVEWSCESNPGTLTGEKIAMLKEGGVTRVSLGVQSFDPKALEFLGRLHTAEEAEVTYHALREQGFGNINIDLMFNLPGVGTEVLEADLEKIVDLAPNHVSCYSLEFEPGTGLTELRDRGHVAEVEPTLAAEQYGRVRSRFAEAGYRQYELFNFTQPGYECRHHLNYWNAGEYFGCGPAAHSHQAGTRWENVRSLKTYCQTAPSGKPQRSFEEHLDPEAKARESLITGLRQISGVRREAFREETGFDIHELGGPALVRLMEYGMVEEADAVLRLTEKGMFVSSAVLSELL